MNCYVMSLRLALYVCIAIACGTVHSHAQSSRKAKTAHAGKKSLGQSCVQLLKECGPGLSCQSQCGGAKCGYKPSSRTIGQDCESYVDCMRGLACSGFKCAKQKKLHTYGMHCEHGFKCAKGLKCSKVSDGHYCTKKPNSLRYGQKCSYSNECLNGHCDGVCKPHKRMGQKCSYGSCASGLVCAKSFCVAHYKAGTPCHYNRECAKGLKCLRGNKPNDVSVCRASKTVGPNELCGFDKCAKGLVCLYYGSSGTCVFAPHSRKLGQKCTEQERTQECAKGLKCHNNKCVKRLRLGQQCTSDIGCPQNTSCRGGELKHCLPPKAEYGQGCGLSGCVKGLWCRKTSMSKQPICLNKPNSLKQAAACYGDKSDECAKGLKCHNNSCKQAKRVKQKKRVKKGGKTIVKIKIVRACTPCCKKLKKLLRRKLLEISAAALKGKLPSATTKKMVNAWRVTIVSLKCK